jgi:hypothetical protein
MPTERTWILEIAQNLNSIVGKNRDKHIETD